ncbi:MAG: hypothetical protein ACYS6K_28475, partial [Planctomycetota bacterium]
TPEENRALEKSVKLRLTSTIHRYLAMKTDFNLNGWKRSLARFADKWHLARQIIEVIVKETHVNDVSDDASLYPLSGQSPVFCPKCLGEMTPINDDTFRCISCSSDNSQDGKKRIAKKGESACSLLLQ